MMGKLRGGRTANRRRLDEQLSAYIDGELRAAERARLEARLATDPALRAELALLRRTIALMHELPSVEHPRNFILPQSAARQPRTRRLARARLAWAAPLLTAASTVVSALFVVALAGNLFSVARLGPTSAPLHAYEAPEAQLSLDAEAPVEAEDEVIVTFEVEAEALVGGERAEEKSAPPVEEAEAEEAPTWAPVEEAEPAPSSAGEPPAGDEEDELQGAQALEIASEETAPEADASEMDAHLANVPEPGTEAAMPLSATLSIEKTEGPTELPAPSPPAEPAPAVDSGGVETADDEAAETAAAEAAGGEAEDAGAEDAKGLDDAQEAPMPATGEDKPEEADPERLVAPPDTASPEHEELLPAARPFPWLAIQIGLGSAALILIAATIWAWRIRR